MPNAMSWLNEPPQWSDQDGLIRAVTGLKTDFWRRTFYGYVTDNGHFYHHPVRLGHLDLPETIDVGVMCCSPERAGLEVTFRDFRIGAPISREGLE